MTYESLCDLKILTLSLNIVIIPPRFPILSGPRLTMFAANVPPADLPSESDPRPNTRIVQSPELFQGQREILIEHAGQTYRLRITRAGKLILQK